jgi:hypothetical protein
MDIDFISTEDFKSLMDRTTEGRCVSIYLPTHRAGPETRQDPTRLKNLLSQAHEQLVALHMRGTDAHKLLEPVSMLLEQNRFWAYLGNTLAVFISPGDFYHYRLPSQSDELVVVANRYYLQPLLPHISGEYRFFILALSQKKIRLLQCDPHRCEEVELPGIPGSLEEALHFAPSEKHLLFYNLASTGRGPQGISHGHGIGPEDNKNEIQKFFWRIDRGLAKALSGEQAPLIIASVEYVRSIYRHANTYAHLLETGIEGNADRLSDRELHEQAWPIAQRFYAERTHKDLDRFRVISGRNPERISTDAEKIALSAYEGRVDLLFADEMVRRWGIVKPAENKVHFHETQKPGDQEIVNFAIINTLQRNGTVRLIKREQMPHAGPMVAVYRY